MVLTKNVESVIFTANGISLRMVLTLNNEDELNQFGQPKNPIETLKMTVTTTAIRHNQELY